MRTGQQPWDVLSRLPAWEVTEVPRPDGDRSGLPDAGTAQRVQALASAYGCADALALAWVRDRAGGPVRVLAGGPGLAGGQDGGQTVLTLPAGARGAPLPDGEAARVLAAIAYWTPIAGITDELLTGGSDPERDGLKIPPSLEDGLLSAWLEEFGWLLLAEPVAAPELSDLAAEAAQAQLASEQHSSPRAKLAARRAAARHDELRQAATAGLWQVHLLAGAATPAAAARVARLLCASADLRGLPYALAARPGASPLSDALTSGGPASRQPAGGAPDTPPGTQGMSWWDGADAARRGEPAAGDDLRPRPGTRHAPAPVAATRPAGDELDTPVPQAPFYGSTRLVAALARAPAREVPGLRFTLRPEFDVTPETTLTVPGRTAVAGPALTAGVVLDWNRVPAGTLTLPAASLNRHVFVCGATGAGKSQTIRNLLEQAATAGIPWLVIEPAKAEYRLMAARLPAPRVIAIRPGELDVAPAGINPLEPAAGPDGSRFPLQAHSDQVRALFLAAFEAEEPFPQVLAAALTRCYEQAGWDLVTGEPRSPGVSAGYPTLADLQVAALAVIEEIGYGREVTDNVRGFVTVRIGSLRLGTTGRFLEGAHRLGFGALLDQNVVLEIEDCGDDRDKAFLIGAVLIRLAEYLRMRQRAEGPSPARLRHITVVEEAHRLLRRPPPGTGSGPAAHAVEMFAGLLAEVRAYGEGLVIAEQIPSKLIPDVIKNTAVKIVHRLPAADDRETVGATMNLTADQSRYLVTLVPGEAAVHADGMDYPILTRMPDGTHREISTPAQASSPAGIITARSASCGPACRQSPCSLRQIRAARRAAEADPRLTLWAELAVIAHLTGWAVPDPAPGFESAIAHMEPRARDCALAHAADAAVAARAPVITPRVSGPALAAHTAAAMRAMLADGDLLCDPEEPQWLAAPWQWAPLLDELRSYTRHNPDSGPHPRTREFEAACHRAIPGRSCAEQADEVQRWDDIAQRDAATNRAVLFGAHQPSAIEDALGARVADPDWPERLADALSAFNDCRWPLDLIREPEQET